MESDLTSIISTEVELKHKIWKDVIHKGTVAIRLDCPNKHSQIQEWVKQDINQPQLNLAMYIFNPEYVQYVGREFIILNNLFSSKREKKKKPKA